MKSESLHALIIDRHFGELSPEAVELLEHHLAANAQARDEAERILESLEVTRETVLRHPELARVPVAVPAASRVEKKSAIMPWLARAAVLALLAAAAGAGGFMAGRSAPADPTIASAGNAPTPRRESPWAKYRMTFDPVGQGMQVVRVDGKALEAKSLR